LKVISTFKLYYLEMGKKLSPNLPKIKVNSTTSQKSYSKFTYKLCK